MSSRRAPTRSTSVRSCSGSHATRGLERIATIGAGAGALMSTAELTRLREEIDASEALVLSNNYYSADLIAFTPASALAVIDLPATDNPLPRRLHQQGGLSSRQLDRSAATLLDVDTPADAAVLKRHPACPPELRALDTWDGELGARIDALMRLVTTPGARAHRRWPRRRAGVVVSRVADRLPRAHARRRARHAGRRS